MATHRGRWALLLLASLTLAVSLLACQTPGTTGPTSNGNTGAIVISTPASGSVSPTPTFPPFSIGAWPSNTTPNASDSITIYVICQVQDPKTGGPTRPAAGVRVQVNLHGPVNQSYAGRTGSNGIATIRVSFSVSQPGSPVFVDVSAIWQGVTYRRQSFFTPAPQAKPSPTADGHGHGGGGGTPGPGTTPTVLPSPPPKP
jgi:hypothetical protein